MTTTLTNYSKFIHKSRYARYIDDQARRESWEETVARLISYLKTKTEDKVVNINRNENMPNKDISTMSEFWYYLYEHFKYMIDLMNNLGYVFPLKFTRITLSVYKFNPLKGGTYVELLRAISAKKRCCKCTKQR